MRRGAGRRAEPAKVPPTLPGTTGRDGRGGFRGTGGVPAAAPPLRVSLRAAGRAPRGWQPAPAGPGVGQPGRGPAAPASPAAPGSAAAGGPGIGPRRGGRRSGSLRPGLLLSFGALVCFLKGCNRASIFSPCSFGNRSRDTTSPRHSCVHTTEGGTT